jgi:hypothetical protein
MADGSAGKIIEIVGNPPVQQNRGNRTADLRPQRHDPGPSTGAGRQENRTMSL